MYVLLELAKIRQLVCVCMYAYMYVTGFDLSILEAGKDSPGVRACMYVYMYVCILYVHKCIHTRRHAQENAIGIYTQYHTYIRSYIHAYIPEGTRNKMPLTSTRGTSALHGRRSSPPETRDASAIHTHAHTYIHTRRHSQ